MAEQELPDLPSYSPAIAPLDPEAFRLAVEGAVAVPLQLSLPELRRLPNVTVTDDFHCLEGWVVRDNAWQGVPLAAVLQLLPEARYVAAYGADHAGNYSVLLSREQALAPTTILAVARGGEPLTHAHGAPLRLHVPGADCFVQVKWTNRLVALTEPIAATGRAIALGRL